MSWSTSASGTAVEVQTALESNLQCALDPVAGLLYAGERETVHRVKETIFQVLRTYDPKRLIAVSAYGHMGFTDWTTKSGAYQQVSITINDAGYPPEPVVEEPVEIGGVPAVNKAALEPEATQDAPSASVDVPAADNAPDAAEVPATAVDDGPTANT